MNKPTLISISGEVLDLQRALEESNGELPLELEMRMSEVLAEDKKKVTSYCNILSSYDNEITYVKARIEEAKEYIKSLERTQDKLLEIAKRAMDIREVDRLEGEFGKLIYTRKSTAVEISCDVESLPEDCRRIKLEVDKLAIKDKLMSGEIIDGCKLIERKNINYK